MDTRHNMSSAKTGELIPPSTDLNDEESSSDTTSEKNDDSRYHFHPNNTSTKLSIPKTDTRLKTNSNRITVNSLPIRRLSRSKINDRVPSPKGK
jgi:hypothetical protein